MKRSILHIIFWIVAFSILNTSVDVADNIPSLPASSSALVEYIEIESIVELFMDTVLDKTLPDQKGNDHQNTSKKNTVFDFSFQEKKERTGFPPLKRIETRIPDYYKRCLLCAGFTSFFSPPPDIA